MRSSVGALFFLFDLAVAQNDGAIGIFLPPWIVADDDNGFTVLLNLIAEYLADIFTNAANLAGICGISIPCGFAQSENGKKLPIGLQLLGKALDESRIFQIAHAYEQSTDWHKARPVIEPMAA